MWNWNWNWIGDCIKDIAELNLKPGSVICCREYVDEYVVDLQNICQIRPTIVGMIGRIHSIII